MIRFESGCVDGPAGGRMRWGGIKVHRLWIKAGFVDRGFRSVPKWIAAYCRPDCGAELHVWRLRIGATIRERRAGP